MNAALFALILRSDLMFYIVLTVVVLGPPFFCLGYFATGATVCWHHEFRIQPAGYARCAKCRKVKHP